MPIDLNGMSGGMKLLTEGYIDYSREVIVGRALPDLRDGLKVVNRRIIYTLKNNYKKGQRVKCASVVGDTMKLHPHGDFSVYSSLVLMTDSNGSLAVPLLKGQGNFGGAHTTNPPAAARYTEVSLPEISEEYFAEMHGIKMIPSYDATTVEPDVLPVSYPAILCNSVSGIAVGFRSNIPSFNFSDVLDLTVEYLRDGKCKTAICPDFSTGGYYVHNAKELERVMETGLGRIKLRGKVTIDGKDITVVEFPYGKTIQGLLGQVNKANIPGVKDAGNVDDYEHGIGLMVSCSAKNRVDDVLMQMYRHTDLQCNFSVDMMSILDGAPVRLGVWGIVAEWVKWRRSVLQKEYEFRIAGWREELKSSAAFMEIISDKVKCDKVVDLTLHNGDDEAIKFILSNYDTTIVTPELASWIIRRRLNDFRTGGKYAQRNSELKSAIAEYESYLSNIDGVIIGQLEHLKSKYGSMFPRHTEVTSLDYEFVDTTEEMPRDTSVCTYTLSEGFLKKLRIVPSKHNYEYEFTGVADMTLIAVDTKGRILRVYTEDIPYCAESEAGVYLPKYLGLTEDADYNILWIEPLEDKTKMIIYKDGNVGFIDETEWFGLNRKVKVIEKGIASCPVGAIVDVPSVLFVTDNNGKVGYEYVKDIKQKDRTAKTRVFNIDNGLNIAAYFATNETGMLIINNVGEYRGPKLSYLKNSGDYTGSGREFVKVY